MSDYLPLSAYGLVGDCRSAALISSQGSLDWWCPRRFDAPSAFARLLDARRGGHCLLRPMGWEPARFQYLEETNILQTTYRHETGLAHVYDVMAVPTERALGETSSAIVRLLTCERGEAPFHLEFAPRFDYARVEPQYRFDEGGVVAVGGNDAVALACDFPLDVVDQRVEGSVRVEEGSSRAVVLRAADADSAPSRVSPSEALRMLEEARTYWQSWARECPYEGPYRRELVRSALVLKLLTYEPTGAVIAAPTTSLPEEIGGVRNWDYRYSWIRDAAFAVTALHQVGHAREAVRFVEWVSEVAAKSGAEDLRIMYRVDGSADLPERELEHLEGYRRSRPVRVGNAAVQQRQLDVYGEAVDCLHLCRVLGTDQEERAWSVVRDIVDYVAAHWHEPDCGIWEIRAPPRHYVHSKVMAWAALDRGVRAIEEMGLEGPLGRWREVRARIHADVLERGYDSSLDAFSQAYGHPGLDAANLLIPIVGFLPADDSRVFATVDRTLERLTSDGMVYRYLDADDGLPGHEATFSVCTFWLIEALAAMGRAREAQTLMEGMLARASPLGLFAEELHPVSGAHLGNYPQGFTHIGVINAAVALSRAEAKEASPSPRQRAAATARSQSGGVMTERGRTAS